MYVCIRFTMIQYDQMQASQMISLYAIFLLCFKYQQTSLQASRILTGTNDQC